MNLETGKQKEKKVALFIDHENICKILQKEKGIWKYDIQALIDRVKGEGILRIAKAYMVTSRNTSEYLYELSKRGIEPIYTPEDRGKSLGDPMFITDVMEVLYEMPFIEKFIICTCDKDIIPLLKKLALKNKEVLVLGIDSSTSEFLINECSRLGFKFDGNSFDPAPIKKFE